MKLVPLLVLALVACKSEKTAKPAAGSAAPVAASAPKASPTETPKLAPYTAPSVPEGEVEPAQAGSAAAPRVAVPHDPMARMLGQLDADHDGKVTPAEVRSGKLNIADPDALDTNGDGQISKDELAAGFREQRIRARASEQR